MAGKGVIEQKKDYLCYMNRRYTYQILILLLAVALYLYFGLGWIAVVVYLVAVAMLWIGVVLYKRKSEQQDLELQQPESKVVKRDLDALTLERRRAQVEVIISFSEAVSRSELDMDRVVKRFDDWYLEYAKQNGLYHKDLYDFILESCKERLKSAKAEYLKSELRLSIDIVRQFMRGRSVEQVVETLADR